MKYLAILSTLLLCGCPINLDTGVKNEPKRADLIGKYVPDPETLKWVRGAGKYSEVETTFELFKDGSFEMVNMPDWWRGGFGESKGGFYSGGGKWDVTKDQSWWKLLLEFNTLKHSSDPGDSGLTTLISIAGESGPYYLRFYVGDPDQRAMLFEKQPEGF
jgi:hypothetical protein